MIADAIIADQSWALSRVPRSAHDWLAAPLGALRAPLDRPDECTPDL